MPGSRRAAIAAAASAAAVIVAAAITAAVLTAPASPAPATKTVPAARRLTGTWAASPVAGPATPGGAAGSCPLAPGGLTGRTVRDIVHPSVGGSGTRVRFSNVFGTAPLTIGPATIAVAGSGGSVAAGSLTRLTFGGSSRVTIAPGAEILSDPARFTVPAGADLAVSATVARLRGLATYHPSAIQTSYLSRPGDFAAAPSGASFPDAISCWLFADGVDVIPAARVSGSVIALGDSITAGAHSTAGANRRWPDDLARRLAAAGGPTLSVIDEGIDGNRLLSNAGRSGVSALARFGRDAASQPGGRVVILDEGINDIAQSDLGHRPVTAALLIRGYQQLIAQAHAAGLRIFGATLTPFRGAKFWSPAGEAIRDAVNYWIATSGAFDGVIDFAAATADPAHPERLRPAYDSGDHVHPDDAGYQAMADAISLAPLLGS